MIRSKKLRRRIFIYIVVIVLCTASFLVGKGYGFDKSEISYTSVLVQRGDTLWQLADKYCDGKNTRKKVDKIKKINNMETSDIYIGTELVIPSEI